VDGLPILAHSLAEGPAREINKCVIERLDQGHLYPVGERRDKYVTVGARTADPLRRRRPLYLKVYLDSLFAGYSEPLLSQRTRGIRSSTVSYLSEQHCC
jgi:hypothetical protein